MLVLLRKHELEKVIVRLVKSFCERRSGVTFVHILDGKQLAVWYVETQTQPPMFIRVVSPKNWIGKLLCEADNSVILVGLCLSVFLDQPNGVIVRLKLQVLEWVVQQIDSGNLNLPIVDRGQAVFRVKEMIYTHCAP